MSNFVPQIKLKLPATSRLESVMFIYRTIFATLKLEITDKQLEMLAHIALNNNTLDTHFRKKVSKLMNTSKDMINMHLGKLVTQELMILSQQMQPRSGREKTYVINPRIALPPAESVSLNIEVSTLANEHVPV